MRQITLLILAGVACVAAFYFMWRDSTVSSMIARIMVSGPMERNSAPPAAQPAAKQPAADSKRVKPRKHTISNVSEGAERSAAAATDLEPPKAPPPPFPTLRDIPAGTVRANLWGTFGEPALRASTSEHGTFVETFVYLSGDHKAATYARLVNGTVVAVSTRAL